MNKIAAYEIALERIELEKRADSLVEAYGTSEGYMPGAYLQAFDQVEMEKEAIISAIGKGITGGIYRAGNALAAGGRASAGRARTGGKIMDWASQASKSPGTLKAIGGGAVGVSALGAFGAGRMSKN